MSLVALEMHIAEAMAARLASLAAGDGTLFAGAELLWASPAAQAAAEAAGQALAPGGGEAPVFASALYGLDPVALESWPKTPAVAVLPISDEAEESVTRKVERPPVQHFVRLGVAYLVRAPNDRKGAIASGRLAALAAAARWALAGWKPPLQREVLSFRAGRLIDISDGRVQWTDEFEIRRVASAGVIEVAPEGAR